MSTLGIIGGSGLYAMDGLSIVARYDVKTPYGRPSSQLVEAELSGTRLLFVARHGEFHRLAPHEINYRANICALKKLGATQVVSLSAVGSMREEIEPGDIVIVDQYIDRTHARAATFFEGGIVAHVSLADPACPHLAQAAYTAAQSTGARVHRSGTYLCIEGPQFSTRAESRLYRSWGISVVGMTAVPEAKLAREAELPYVTIALSTDYDCWHETQESVSVQAVLEVLKKNTARAHAILQALPEQLPDARKSPASRALDHAIITNGQLSAAPLESLDWLLSSDGRPRR